MAAALRKKKKNEAGQSQRAFYAPPSEEYAHGLSEGLSTSGMDQQQQEAARNAGLERQNSGSSYWSSPDRSTSGLVRQNSGSSYWSSPDRSTSGLVLRTSPGPDSSSGGTTTPPRALRAGIVESLSGWWGGPPPKLADPGVVDSQHEDDGSETARANAYREFAKNAKHVFGYGNRDDSDEDTSPRKEPAAKRWEPPTPRDQKLADLQAVSTLSPQAMHKAPLPENFEQAFFKQEPSQQRPREQSPGRSGASSSKEREQQQQRLIVHGTRPSIPTASRQIATSSASDQRRSAAPHGGQQSFSDGSSSVVGGGYNVEGSERAGAGVGGMIEASTLCWGGAAEHGNAPLFLGSDGSRLRDQRGGFDAPAYPLSPQVSPPNPTPPPRGAEADSMKRGAEADSMKNAARGAEADSMKNALSHEGHRRRPASPAKRRPRTGASGATPDPPSPELLDNRIARNYNVTSVQSSPPMQGGAPSSWGSSVTPSSGGGTIHGTASPGTGSEIEKCVKRMQKEGNDPHGRRAHYASKLADILRSDDAADQLAAHSAGVLPVAMTFMKGSDRLLKRRCTAIASRLCFNPQIGDEWVSMGGATLLADIVVDFSASVSDKDAKTAALAAGALWALSARSQSVKADVGPKPALAKALVSLCQRQSTKVHSQAFVMSQACGCIAELCVGDATQREITKEVMSRAGGVTAAIWAFGAGHEMHDSNLMVLSSTALCNIMEGRASVKADAVKEGAIEAFSRVLLDSSTPIRLRTACASALFNLASSHVSLKYGEPVKAAMRNIEASSKIDERLLCSSPSQPQAGGAIDPSQIAMRRPRSPQRQSHVAVDGLQAPTKSPHHDQASPRTVAAPGLSALQSVHQANGWHNNVGQRGVGNSQDSSLGPSQAPKMRNFVTRSVVI